MTVSQLSHLLSQKNMIFKAKSNISVIITCVFFLVVLNACVDSTTVVNSFQKLTASDLQTNDKFGNSVSISKDGMTALIGAYFFSTETGAAYIFRYNSTSAQYEQSQKLAPSDPQNYDQFGQSVAISADGNIALIGAWREDEKGSDAGAAYIFKYNSGTGQYAQLQKLMATDAEAGDNFGYSVSLNTDGYTALIGAYYESEKGTNAGAAYIFKYNSTSLLYDQLQKLTASDGQASDIFGNSVSISTDGSTALIGAKQEAEKAANAGAAYIFKYNSGSGQYTQLQKLMATDGSNGDFFGYSVSISPDGGIALIGSNENDGKAYKGGAAYIFSVNSTGLFEQTQKLMASDGQASDQFGNSVSISSDASTALIGAWMEDETSTDGGAAYIFQVSSGQYLQTQKLVPPTVQAGRMFGCSVTMSANGSTVLIGAYAEITKLQYLIV